MKKRKSFQKKHGILERIASLVLAFAMVLTMGAFSNLAPVDVHAEGNTYKLYFHLPSGSASDWGLNVWGGATVVDENPVTFTPTGWTSSVTQLYADSSNPGWAYITISGNVDGMAFVDRKATKEYKCWNARIAVEKKTEAYYEPSDEKWYEEIGKQNEITIPVARDIYVLTGDITGWNFDTKLVQDASDTSVYSVTVENVQPGEYYYKILQDTEYFGWDKPWGSGSYGDGKRYLKVTETSNITFSIDLDAVDKDVVNKGVSITVTPVDPPEFDRSNITVHFKNTAGWETVCANLAETGNWTPINGYAYANQWPGAIVEPDDANEGWNSFTITMDAEKPFKLIFNNGDNGQQTGNIAFTSNAADIEKWFVYDETENAAIELAGPPADWGDSPQKELMKLTSVESPELTEEGVVFRYESSSAMKVQLAGDMTDWGTNPKNMAKGDDGIWSITLPWDAVSTGTYQYRFIVDGQSDGIVDPACPMAAGGNSLLVVPGLTCGTLEVEREKTTALPELTLYDEEGNCYPATGLDYQVEKELEGYVTIADGQVTVSKDFEGDCFDIKVSGSEEGMESNIAVTVVDKLYHYTIYYYDWTADHMKTDASALWIWQDGGADGREYSFESVEMLNGEREWMRAEVDLSYYDRIRLIPKNASADPNNATWDWQGKEYVFSNTTPADNTTIYVVSNESKVFTALPALQEPGKILVELEYQRPDENYEGWNVYTRDSGYGSDVTIKFEKKMARWLPRSR